MSSQSSQHGGSTPSSYTFPEYVNSSLNYITLIITILGVGRELTLLTRDDRHLGDGWSHAVTQEGPALWLNRLVPVGIFQGASRASLVGGSVGLREVLGWGSAAPLGNTRSYTLGHSRDQG